MKPSRSFASDNNAGVHPVIMEAMNAANIGHVVAYGDDPFTERAVSKFKEHLGEDIGVYFVFGGTGANVLGLNSITESYNAIICAETSHINVDECGAPEHFTGCKLLAIETPNGKIESRNIDRYLHAVGNEHHVQPHVISISQSTEMGTVYTAEEIKALSEYAHHHGFLLHVDGARIGNAAASLGLTLRGITTDAGVDLLSFGGTKNGMMYGEAVVFFNSSKARNFQYIRKQGMQLPSKMRFISAQFEALLSGDLWLNNARHSNRMAQILARELESMSQIQLTQQVQANAVFAIIPPDLIPLIQAKYFFYVWDDARSEVRLMTSFDTTEKDIEEFVAFVRSVVK